MENEAVLGSLCKRLFIQKVLGFSWQLRRWKPPSKNKEKCIFQYLEAMCNLPLSTIFTGTNRRVPFLFIKKLMFTTLLYCIVASSKNVYLQKAEYLLTHMTSETHFLKHLFIKGLPKNHIQTRPSRALPLSAESFEWFIDDPAHSRRRVIWVPLPPLPISKRQTGRLRKRDKLADGKGGGGRGVNGRGAKSIEARNPGPL